MKHLLKPALILTPAIFALAACDAPPADDPAADGLEDGTGMEASPMEEPVDTAPMDDTMPADGGLEGGAAPADEVMPEASEAIPPVGEDGTTDDAAESSTDSSMSEGETETSE
ncbi:hypothetical protein [Parasphingorhabdus cellanae]|uniref:Lipoprotein n=1 Tax=Parasphingorhabdus cellanae TaxID=2806553 RepID=A0ABX7T5I9_9SPHN|nr:hypothetical protein [Parasphingorhabdus cellanae]QTD56859.1 hypothetical protein J4G78_04595 [Parasphingorhabdus cellanae]